MSQLLPQSPPNLRVIFDELKSEIFKEINCVLPGIIQEVDYTNQTVSVQIAIKKITNVALNGTQTTQNYPLLINVPFVFMSGGSAHLTMPISIKDSCIVLFSDRDIENWWLSGAVVPPNTARTHDKTDAFAIVGISNSQNAITNYFNGTQLMHDENTHIDFTSGQINIYGNVTIHGTLTTVDGRGTINYNTHVHNGVMSGSSDTGEPVA